MKEYVKRYVDLDRILDRKSVFLIGPRMCGKSMYAKNEVRKPVLYWNLLSNTLYYRIVRNPALLEETLKAEGITEGLVVIDEIQRAPQLLYTVHQFIEDTDLVFLMTGSSHKKHKISILDELMNCIQKLWSTLDLIYDYKSLSDSFCLERFLKKSWITHNTIVKSIGKQIPVEHRFPDFVFRIHRFAAHSRANQEYRFSVKNSVEINITLYVLFHDFTSVKVIIVQKMNF